MNRVDSVHATPESNGRTAPVCPVEVVGELVAGLLREGRQATFRVDGVSMRPTLKTGDVVTLESLPSEGASPGDIVAFLRGPHIVLHRVAAVLPADGERRYLTAGDGLVEDDGIQLESAVIGVVTRVSTNRGGWDPTTLRRRAQGRLRVFLALHPRLRVRLGALKSRVRQVLAVNGRAGARA